MRPLVERSFYLDEHEPAFNERPLLREICDRDDFDEFFELFADLFIYRVFTFDDNGKARDARDNSVGNAEALDIVAPAVDKPRRSSSKRLGCLLTGY
jgi:hypothetical protein